MNIFAVCPCCSTSMLHYFGNRREYWFCRHCWSEMPDIKDFQERKQYGMNNIINLSPRLLNAHQ